jgi:hypothetical protein
MIVGFRAKPPCGPSQMILTPETPSDGFQIAMGNRNQPLPTGGKTPPCSVEMKDGLPCLVIDLRTDD